LGPAKIRTIEETNAHQVKKWKWAHLPQDEHGHYTYSSTYKYTPGVTNMMTSEDVMRLYGCLLTTTAMFAAQDRASVPESSAI
jgi:hypothetical protein